MKARFARYRIGSSVRGRFGLEGGSEAGARLDFEGLKLGGRPERERRRRVPGQRRGRGDLAGAGAAQAPSRPAELAGGEGRVAAVLPVELGQRWDLKDQPMGELGHQ